MLLHHHSECMASDVTAVHLFLFAEMLLEEENTWLVLSPSALAKYSKLRNDQLPFSNYPSISLKTLPTIDITLGFLRTFMRVCPKCTWNPLPWLPRGCRSECWVLTVLCLGHLCIITSWLDPHLPSLSDSGPAKSQLLPSRSTSCRLPRPKVPTTLCTASSCPCRLLLLQRADGSAGAGCTELWKHPC